MTTEQYYLQSVYGTMSHLLTLILCSLALFSLWHRRVNHIIISPFYLGLPLYSSSLSSLMRQEPLGLF